MWVDWKKIVSSSSSSLSSSSLSSLSSSSSSSFILKTSISSSLADMKFLQISLNTAQSGFKPSTFMSLKTHSPQVALPMPLHSCLESEFAIQHWCRKGGWKVFSVYVFLTGYKSCTLVAHDWGGVVSWYFASLHPEKVDRLVICNAPHALAMRKHLYSVFSQFMKSWWVFLYT